MFDYWIIFFLAPSPNHAWHIGLPEPHPLPVAQHICFTEAAANAICHLVKTNTCALLCSALLCSAGSNCSWCAGYLQTLQWDARDYPEELGGLLGNKEGDVPQVSEQGLSLHLWQVAHVTCLLRLHQVQLMKVNYEVALMQWFALE